MESKKVMVVEDESIIALDIKYRLKNMGYHVAAVVPSGEEALKVVKNVNPDVVLMDIVLRGNIDGVQTAESISKQYNIPVIFITSYSDESTLESVYRITPHGYLTKPFNEDELKKKLENALYNNSPAKMSYYN